MAANTRFLFAVILYAAFLRGLDWRLALTNQHLDRIERRLLTMEVRR
jgi:hypothetical protein